MSGVPSRWPSDVWLRRLAQEGPSLGCTRTHAPQNANRILIIRSAMYLHPDKTATQSMAFRQLGFSSFRFTKTGFLCINLSPRASSSTSNCNTQLLQNSLRTHQHTHAKWLLRATEISQKKSYNRRYHKMFLELSSWPVSDIFIGFNWVFTQTGRTNCRARKPCVTRKISSTHQRSPFYQDDPANIRSDLQDINDPNIHTTPRNFHVLFTAIVRWHWRQNFIIYTVFACLCTSILQILPYCVHCCSELRHSAQWFPAVWLADWCTGSASGPIREQNALNKPQSSRFAKPFAISLS